MEEKSEQDGGRATETPINPTVENTNPIMKDAKFRDEAILFLSGETASNMDLCIGMSKADREEAIIGTIAYFLDEYYGRDRDEVLHILKAHFPSGYHVLSAIVKVKGQVCGGKHKKYFDHMLAGLDSLYYIDPDTDEWSVSERSRD